VPECEVHFRADSFRMDSNVSVHAGRMCLRPSASVRCSIGSVHASRLMCSRAQELLAGGLAGACGKSSVAPLERVKILIQVGCSGRTRIRTRCAFASVASCFATPQRTSSDRAQNIMPCQSRSTYDIQLRFRRNLCYPEPV
jgi:hypothetical protein